MTSIQDPGPQQDAGFFRTLFEAAPDKMVALTPVDYRVVAVTDSYLRATHTTREQLVGQRLFDVFPDNPEDPTTDGSQRLKESLQRVIDLGCRDVMAPQRYPVPRATATGIEYEERYWSVINTPVLDEQGKVRYVINRAEDLTPLLANNQPSDTGVTIAPAEARRRALELEVALRERELRDVQDQLVFRESSLRAAQRLLGLGLWQIDLATGRIRLSQSARTLLNIGPNDANPLEELLFDPALSSGKDPESTRQFQQWLTSPPRQVEFRRRITLPDGSVRHLHGSGELIDTTEGRFMAGVMQDITRQVNDAASLASAENLQRMAGEVARIAGWRVDLKTGQSHWADELWDIYELAKGPRPAMSQLFLPGDRDRLRASYDRCRNEAIPFDDTFQLTSGRGNHRWVRIVAEPEFDERGQVIAIQGAAQDVSTQKRQEKILRERVKELDCLHRTSVILADSEREAGALLGELANIIPPAMLFSDSSVVRICFGNEEYRSRHWRETALAIRADIRHSGKLAGWIEAGYPQTHYEDPPRRIFFLDEERHMLDAIARQIGQVMDNREATRRLAQAQRMEAVGQLTGGIAHDFNNLLTVILGNAELLKEALEQHPQLGRLAEMVSLAADRGAELTSRLLAFARRQALEPEVVAVERMVSELEPLLRRTLTGNIDLAICCPPDLWSAEVDPVQLETALLNLVINARDAMPEGGQLSIEVGNTRLERTYTDLFEDLVPGEYVVLAVTDTGTGMTPDVRQHAFEPFFTTKDTGKGSGLGLSMVYGFVKQSGGHVQLYSEPGEGTTVRIYLPRSGATASRGEPVAEPAPEQGRNEHILVVEDDDMVRTHVLGLLQSLGYRTSSAASGPEALEALRRLADIDLLFTDVIMPGGLNGPQLASAALAVRPGLRILYTSGYTENAIVHHGRLDPGVLLLSKPYRSQELARKLRAALDG